MEATFNVRPSVCFEVQKITAVSIGEGNQMNYQVQWAPTWINSVHLMGCEHLIEEFICQQSEKGQVVDDDKAAYQISTHDLQNDELGDTELIGLTHHVTEKDKKQICVVVPNEKTGYSNGTKDNLAVSSMDKSMLNSGCQSAEGRQINPNHEWMDIGGVHSDGVYVGTHLNNVNIGTDTAAKEDNVKTDYKFQRDLEVINREELVVVETDLTHPNVLNKDARSKHKTLNKPSKKYECNICQQVCQNSHSLSQHSHTIHKRKWECELCGRECKSETALLLHMHTHKRKQFPAQHMIPIHDLLTDLRENVSEDTGVLSLPRRQVAHTINKQACIVVNNNHSSEHSNTTQGNGDQTVSSMDTDMSNSHCQITDMSGGNQMNNLGSVEKSINSINFNGSDISTKVNDNMHVEVDKFANVNDEDGDSLLFFGSEHLKSMLHLSTDIESDRVFRNVVEVKMEETVVVKSNLADPNIFSKDTTNKCQSLKKSSKRKKSNVCHKMKNENNDKLWEHSGKVHTGKWECDFCDMKCRNKNALLLHRREHKGQNHIHHSAHKCSYCDKMFDRRSKLVEHTRVHTNERPFDCKLCEQSFKRKEHLKKQLS